MHRGVALWDWELMHFQAYVYIMFVYHVVYVDMNTRSSQLNHLNLESFWGCVYHSKWNILYTDSITVLVIDK